MKAVKARSETLKCLQWLIAGLVLLFGDRVSVAQPANFAGQRMSILVGTTTGGSYDFYARLVSRHLGKYLPGNPSIVVVNMPGAGGVIEANWLYNVAPKDGTALGIVPLSAAFEPLFGNGQPKYDPRKFAWLASLNNYVGSVVVWSQTPFQSAGDLLQQEVIIGGGGSGSDITIWPNLFKALIGAKVKLINGYVGTSNVFLAMERGEVQGMVGLDWDGVKSSKGDWVRDKKIRMLMQIAQTRAPDLPDVPTVLDFARTPADRQVLELFLGRQKYARPFAAPPGLPDAVVAALRDGFAKVAQDVDFIREATAAHSPINYVPGEEVDALAQRIYASPPELIQRAAQELAKANE